MRIQQIEINDSQFQVLAKKFGNIFSSPEWLSIYDSSLKVYGLFLDQNLKGAFLSYEFSRLGMKFMIPPPFSPSNELILEESLSKEQAVKLLLNFMNEKKAVFKRMALQKDYLSQFGEISGMNFQKGVSYILSLKGENEISDSYQPKRRQQIRRAERDGLLVEKIKDKKVILDLISQTYARQKKKVALLRVEKIISTFLNSGKGYGFVTYKDSIPLAGYFCVQDSRTAYYIFGGYDANRKHIGAGPLAMDACIREAKKRELLNFDFEGSMVPSIANFFKEFGGVKVEYPIFEQHNLFGKTILGLKKMIWR